MSKPKLSCPLAPLFLLGAGIAQCGSLTFTSFNLPGDNGQTIARGINDAGQIVGACCNALTLPPMDGFLLNGGSYTAITYPGSTVDSANGVNNSGEIVGFYGNGGPLTGFLLNGGAYTSNSVPGSTATADLGINGSGQVVGNYTDASSQIHGFVLSGGVYTTLDYPGSTHTNAQGINDSDAIVGEYITSGPYHAFLLSGGVYMNIDFPGSIGALAVGINNLGDIVGLYDLAANPTMDHGFLLSGGVYTPFDFPGAIATDPSGINDSGQIVGTYLDSQFQRHGFIATQTPEPSTLFLTLGFGLLLNPVKRLQNLSGRVMKRNRPAVRATHRAVRLSQRT